MNNKILLLALWFVFLFGCQKPEVSEEKANVAKTESRLIAGEEISKEAPMCYDVYYVEYESGVKTYEEYLYSTCSSSGGAPSGGGKVYTATPEYGPVESNNIPCASSFNFVKNGTGTFQSAVITNYSFSVLNTNNNKRYPLSVGLIEVGMPSVTYSGRVVTNSQALAVEAATKAEQRIAASIIRATNAYPATASDAFNNATFKTKFKDYYRQELNRLLRSQYGYSSSAWPGTVLYDDAAFTLKDATQYRLLKYPGLDC